MALQIVFHNMMCLFSYMQDHIWNVLIKVGHKNNLPLQNVDSYVPGIQYKWFLYSRRMLI